MANKTIFVSADHGLAIVYFLQSNVISTLLEDGNRVVVLTDDGLLEQIRKRFEKPGLFFEGLRLKQARQYFHTVDPTWQYWLNFLRAEGASKKINTEALRCHIAQIDFEARGKRKLLMPWMKMVISSMRKSQKVREWVYQSQLKYSPDLYTDLFEKYQPDLVVASTPGWRLDRYLLRQAASRGVNTAAVIVGWDNPSSYSISGAPVNWINCWSEVQKQELVDGEDWNPAHVHVGGIPSYDGYFRREWVMPKEDYFKLHNLDLNRKLIGYACSFITFSPNIQNIEALARLVSSDTLKEPSQLLIRLHPNHFLSEPLFAGEREKIFELARQMPHVHVVEPVPLGGELGYYSGEDMPEKTSMMAYSDVFTTVYSTMVVEAAIHDRPIVAVCIDAAGGWNKSGRFSLPLSKIGKWPTHQRFIQAEAGKVASNETELKEILDKYLIHPEADRKKRKDFIKNECTYADGSSGKKTGKFLLSIMEKP